jgi:PAS domain S-box-containing protein
MTQIVQQGPVENNSRFETLISAIPDIIMEVDTAKVYCWANQAGIDFFGRDVIGKPADYYFEGDQDTYLIVDPLFKGSENTVYLESWQRRTDGQNRLLAWWCRTLKDSNGTVTGALSTARDITETRQTELLLQESEKKYRGIIERMNDGIWIIDKDNNTTFVNPAMSKMLGYTLDEMLGSKLFDHMDDEGVSIANENLERRRKGIAEQHTFKFISKDKAPLWALVNTNPLFDSDGAYFGAQAIITSISDLRKTAEKLEESEERFRLAFENSPDGMALISPEGQCFWVNSSICSLLGYTDDEFHVLTMKDITHPDDMEFDARYLEQMLESEIDTYSVLKRFISKHGRIVLAQMFMSIVRGTDGKPRYFIAQVKDITAMKRSEAERQSLLEIMSGLVETGDLHDFLRIVHLAIGKLIIAENFFVILYNKGTGLFEEVYSEDIFDPPSPPSGLEKSISAYVFHSGEPLLLTQERFDELEGMGLVEMVGTNSPSWMGVPLKSASDTIGVMVVQDYNKADSYKEEDLNFFVSVAAQIAIAVEYKLAGDLLRASEEKWRKLVTMMPDFIALHDTKGHYLYLNHYADGFSEKDILGKNIFDFMEGESKEKYWESFSLCIQSGTTQKFEYSALGPNGETRIYLGYLAPLIEHQEVTTIISVARDITENKKRDAAMISAIKEKEILLREINHRVKNNLQVISSLLNLKAHRIKDESLKNILWESRNRIRSIALVHEKLYQTGNFAEISLGEYGKALIAELYRAYVTDPGKIPIALEIDKVKLPLAKAIPCGLILNEIISNSLQHAFPSNVVPTRKPGIFICITVLPDHIIQIVAGDNGIGLPEGNPDSGGESLGIYLIRILSEEQLHGTMVINNENGTTYTITFNPLSR